MKNWKKLLLFSVLIVSLALVIAAAFFIAGVMENGEIEEDGEVDYEEIMNAIYLDGEMYLPKRGVRNYLIMGVDKFGDADGGWAAQADFIMILSFDVNTKTYDTVAISRDTMAEVDYYDIKGNKGETRVEQIALSHAYGNVLEISNPLKCKNTEASVSRLFHGMHFDGYMSMTMDAVSIIVDHVGGVEVTIEDDMTSVDPLLVKGEKVTLDGELALKFVRARGELEDGTNAARMKRQESFLNAFFSKIGEDGIDEMSTLKCYEKVAEKLVSNMGESGYEELVRRLSSYSKRDSISLKGESRVGATGYMEFHPDDGFIKELLKNVFYEKKQ